MYQSSPSSPPLVTLPPSVEQMLERICVQQSLPPADAVSRRELAEIGEEASLDVLGAISRSQARNLNAFIKYLAKKSLPAPSPRKSLNFRSQSCSPSKDTLMQVVDVYVSWNGEWKRDPTGFYYFSGDAVKAIEVPCSISYQELTDIIYETISLRPDQFVVDLKCAYKASMPLAPVQIATDRDVKMFVKHNQAVDPLQKVPLCISVIQRDRNNQALFIPETMKDQFITQEAIYAGLTQIKGQCEDNNDGYDKGDNEREQFRGGDHHIYAEEPNGYYMSGCRFQRKDYQSVQRQSEGLPRRSPKKLCRKFASPQLVALNELEFRKAFLILSYIGRKKLEEVISSDEIWTLKDLSMAIFERRVWDILGKKYIKEEDRRKALDWDSGKTHIYHCHVFTDGNCMFKGPFLNKTKTHLQRVLGDENVLNVKFEEVTGGSSFGTSPGRVNFGYSKVATEGIYVGLRHFRFFVFKDGGKEEKKKNPTTSPVKCYFICMDCDALSELPSKTVHGARCLFMHAHTVSSLAKYMARFSLILSKTIKLDVDLTTINIQRIEDIPCQDENGSAVCNEDGEPLIHTDGTGFISEDLALKCPKNVYKGKPVADEYIKKCLGNLEVVENVSILGGSYFSTSEPPLLMQFRMFYNGVAVKGTLLVNRKLPTRTIQIRPSMIKVEADSKLSHVQTANSFEIVGTSNQPKKTYLSRYLIALLSYGGVPKEYFMELLRNALEDTQSAYSNRRAALRVSLRNSETDDFSVAKMILSGVPLNEPYLQHRLSFLMNEERKGLKGGRIPLSECYYLMGTTDPTGMLQSDEVCIILESGQISGKVLVYKHPGLHFGDIHVLNAKYVRGIEDQVGNSKYAIFFPTKGQRSLADEMANSDFDGDMYWVSRNPQLLQYFRANRPWVRTYPKQSMDNKKPTDITDEDLEYELFHCFLMARFQPSRSMGIAAESWLAFMDWLLILGEDPSEETDSVKEKILQLVDIYYFALDAPKSGMKVEVPKKLIPPKYPHFMERNNSYHSTSILGQIYSTVQSFQVENLPMEDIWILPSFDVKVPDACLMLWRSHYEQYRYDMAAALRHHDVDDKEYCADQVIKKYKQLLYGDGALDFEESSRNREAIFNEALAIYRVTYDHAKTQRSVRYCNFAWKIAGSALCKFHIMKQGDKSILCSSSALQEIFR